MSLIAWGGDRRKHVQLLSLWSWSRKGCPLAKTSPWYRAGAAPLQAEPSARGNVFIRILSFFPKAGKAGVEARKGRGTRHHCQPYLRHGHCQGHENCYRTEGPPAEWAGTQGRSPLQVRHRQVENIPVPAQRRSGNGAGGRDTAGCRTRRSSQGSSLKGETATR